MKYNVKKANASVCRGAVKQLIMLALWAGTILAAVVVDLPALAHGAARHPFAWTQSGWVTGTHVAGVDEYLGIPYAAPPVGSLRWRPPQPYGFFPGFVLHATQFGSECTQPPGFGKPAGGSENCLFLNVYTPQQSGEHERWEDGPGHHRRHGLPVMVWIHGGGLVFGDGSTYDPSELVKHGVIVVTLNYRLGYLGFFAQSAIDAEGHLNGNYGLMDQQFALQWIQRNIGAFGGDPRRVTIFGDSAGGQSVYAQLASPQAAGLFSGAIAESGAYAEFQDYYSFVLTLAQGETQGSTGVTSVPSGAAIANSVGCTDQSAACLRAVPAAALAAGEPTLAIFPFVDGALLPETIEQALSTGQFNHVPVISGSTHDEWRLIVALQYDLSGNPITTSTEYSAGVAALEGSALAPTLATLYPYDAYPSGEEAMGALGTDSQFDCPELNSVNDLAKYVPTYAYEFNDQSAPPSQSAFGGALTFPLGAYHTAELQYLFHVNGTELFGMPVQPLSPEQTRLSKTMIDYWTQFAKTGNPNAHGQPFWDRYSAASGTFQSLVSPQPHAESNFDSEHQCSTFWNTF